jgi:hypothetical protein
LDNYYNQLVFEFAIENRLSFPSIYLNALDHNGLIRVGTEKFGPMFSPPQQCNNTSCVGYCYIDSMILANIYEACEQHPHVDRNECKRLETLLNQRRSLNPIRLWQDENHGRLINWP